MIAADTSALVNFYNNENVHPALEMAMADGVVVIPCVVLGEILSTPNLPKPIRNNLTSIPVLYPRDDEFWVRVADLRQRALSKSRKARLADTLIAQVCLDFGIPLITQDKDFRSLAEFCRLRLI